jgi:hypothetical protein
MSLTGNIQPRYFRLLACEVLTREIGFVASHSPHAYDITFTMKEAHNQASLLRDTLQKSIDAAELSGRPYEAILLAYGLCGNATEGLKARKIPLVIPRAHDCCTLFLGSKKLFKEHFQENPSRPFSSAGYMEHGGNLFRNQDDMLKIFGGTRTYEDYVREYGEEEARYLVETLGGTSQERKDDKAVFITTECTRDTPRLVQFQQETTKDGKTGIVIEGSIRLIKMLMEGDWRDEDFLIVKAGEQISGVYDYEKVMETRKDKETA